MCSRWFVGGASSDKLIEAPAGKPTISALPSPSINIHNETNNVTNVVTPPAAVVPVPVPVSV